MTFNEGSKQISSQIVASLKEVPVLMFGLIFIEISRGPSLFENFVANSASWYMTPYKMENKIGRHLVCHQCAVDHTA